MINSYLNLVTNTAIKEAHERINEPKTNLKDAIVTYAANLDSSVNIYEALRKFIESYTEDINRRSELLDTLEFCEADEADLEATLIKLKIAMDNPILSETVTEAVSTRVCKKIIPILHQNDEWHKVSYLDKEQREAILDCAKKAYNDLGYPEKYLQQVLDYILERRVKYVNSLYDMYQSIIHIMKSKLKIELPNYQAFRALIEPTPRNSDGPPKWIRFDSVTDYKKLLKSSLSWIVADIRQEHSIVDIERKLLGLQNTFFTYADKMPKETVRAYEDAFEYLWNLTDTYSKISTQEGLKMIDKDFLIKESDVTKAIKNNRNETPRKELEPVRCFVVLDKNNKPMLNKGGIIITNTPDAEKQIQQRADDLYRLIHNAKSIYVIEDEAYDKSVDICNVKDYVKFVKENGRLIKPSEGVEPFKTHDLDDEDFLVNVDELFD